ncbi:transporter [Lasius niger]|uniref:Transporter n=1 Tax=Lasius niger TaxID=67767 RepID=A0A0J7KTR2_LASNI|nr:transporter [Lasius niger]
MPSFNVLSNKELQKYARFFLAICIITASTLLLLPFLPALGWAVIISICSWPLYYRAEGFFPKSKHWRPLILPTLAVTLISLLAIGPICYFTYEASVQAIDAIPSLMSMIHKGLPLPKWFEKFPFIANWWDKNLANPEGIKHLAQSIDVTPAANLTKNLSLAVMDITVQFTFALTAVFCILKYSDVLIQQVNRVSIRFFGAQGEALAQQIVASVYGTLTGLVLVGIGEGLLIGVIYIIAQAPQALLMGLLTGISSMIPFVGTFVLLLCCLVIAFKSIAWAIACFIIGYLIQSIADQFIRPAMIGGRTNLPFLWVLFGILGGIELMGLLGLFLGPAIMACMTSLWRAWAAPPEIQNLRENTSPDEPPVPSSIKLSPRQLREMENLAKREREEAYAKAEQKDKETMLKLEKKFHLHAHKNDDIEEK